MIIIMKINFLILTIIIISLLLIHYFFYYKQIESFVDNQKVYEVGLIGDIPWYACPNFLDQNAKWIWNTSNARTSAPIGSVDFYYNYTNSGNSKNIIINCIVDNICDIYLNNNSIGNQQGGWGGTGGKFKAMMQNGTNLFKFSCKNQGGSAGLLVTVIDADNLNSILFSSNKNWTLYPILEKNLCGPTNTINTSGIKYKVPLLIKNFTGYLGSCGKADNICSQQYNNIGVGTYTSDDGSYMISNINNCRWLITNIDTSLDRDTIYFNDTVYIRNDPPNPSPYILETCDYSSCSSSGKPGYSVDISTRTPGLWSHWQIRGISGSETGPINYGDSIILKNLWDTSVKGEGRGVNYLNSCGSKTISQGCQSGFGSVVNTSLDIKNPNNYWMFLENKDFNDNQTISQEDYILYKYNTGYCITVNDSINNASSLGVSKYIGQLKNDSMQKWLFEDGYIKLKNDPTYCMTLSSNNTSSGTPIILYRINPVSYVEGYQSQQWLVENNIIKYKKNPSLVITLSNNQLTGPSKIVIWNFWQTALINDDLKSQRWIVPAEKKLPNKCTNFTGWFNPFSTTFLGGSDNTKLIQKLAATPDQAGNDLCKNACTNNEECDYFTLNTNSSSCQMYQVPQGGKIYYSNKKYPNGQYSGAAKQISICKKNITPTTPNIKIANVNLCNTCTFPELMNNCFKPESGCSWQKCCPKSWSNSSFGAQKGISCATGIITDRTNEGWGNPVTNCTDAGGFVMQTKIYPPEFVCTKKKMKGILHWVNPCTECSINWCQKITTRSETVENDYIVGVPLSNDFLGEFGCSQITINTPVVQNSKTGAVYVVENIDNTKPNISWISDCSAPIGECQSIITDLCSNTSSLPDKKKTVSDYYNIAQPLSIIGCDVLKNWNNGSLSNSGLPTIRSENDSSPNELNSRIYVVLQTQNSNRLNSGGYLLPNQYLVSENKKFNMYFSNDGDLYTVENHTGDILWRASDNFTNLKNMIVSKQSANTRLNLQLDGNLCIISNNTNIWCLGTSTSKEAVKAGKGNYLTISNTGGLFMYNINDNVLWRNGI